MLIVNKNIFFNFGEAVGYCRTNSEWMYDSGNSIGTTSAKYDTDQKLTYDKTNRLFPYTNYAQGYKSWTWNLLFIFQSLHLSFNIFHVFLIMVVKKENDRFVVHPICRRQSFTCLRTYASYFICLSGFREDLCLGSTLTISLQQMLFWKCPANFHKTTI